VSYFVLYMSSPCLVGLAAEVNKTVKLSNGARGAKMIFPFGRGAGFKMN